jgi:hypothetical protein
MRLTNLMTFVCALLLLASIPACLQFARLCGLHPAASMATAAGVAMIALIALRRG